MIGGLFIYNHKGEVLISRVYRDDIGYVSGERTFLNFRGDVLLGRGGRSGIDRGIISLGRLTWLHLTSFAIICLCVGEKKALPGLHVGQCYTRLSFFHMCTL